MIDRARESRNPKKVIRVTLMESYGEIGRVPVNLYKMYGRAPKSKRKPGLTRSKNEAFFCHICQKVEVKPPFFFVFFATLMKSFGR